MTTNHTPGPWRVGDRARFHHHHLLQTVSFTARVVKIDGGCAWVEMPPSVRNLRWPPVGGKRYAKYKIASLCRAIAKAEGRP